MGIKSNTQGGATGFWQQSRSSRVILALQASAGGSDRNSRLFRVLRPTLHTSAKPQYIRYRQLTAKYLPVRDQRYAEKLWHDEYRDTVEARTQEVHLLCGAILPVWTPLHE